MNGIRVGPVITTHFLERRFTANGEFIIRNSNQQFFWENIDGTQEFQSRNLTLGFEILISFYSQAMCGCHKNTFSLPTIFLFLTKLKRKVYRIKKK